MISNGDVLRSDGTRIVKVQRLTGEGAAPSRGRGRSRSMPGAGLLVLREPGDDGNGAVYVYEVMPYLAHLGAGPAGPTIGRSAAGRGAERSEAPAHRRNQRLVRRHPSIGALGCGGPGAASWRARPAKKVRRVLPTRSGVEPGPDPSLPTSRPAACVPTRSLSRATSACGANSPRRSPRQSRAMRRARTAKGIPASRGRPRRPRRTP